MILRALAILSVVIGGAAPALASQTESMRYLSQADAEFAKGQPRSAHVLLMNATDADPKNALAWIYQARVALSLGDGQGAGKALDRAVEAGFPVNRTLHLRAHAFIMVHRAADALLIARADHVAAPYRGYAARMRGRALADLGDYVGAAREFETAIAITPRGAPLWIDIARFRLLTGERLGAISASDRAVALDRSNVDALVLKGELVRDQYGLAASLPWFEKALAIDRFDIDAQIQQAATLGDMGRTREMLAVTRGVQALDPANPRAFYLQAAMAARARKFLLADKLIDQTGGALDTLPGMLLLKGTVSYQLGNFSEASAALAQLVDMQPNNVAARRLLSLNKWHMGDFDAVIATLQPAIDGTDADSYALMLAARAYEAKGDRETAATYLDRAALARGDGTQGRADQTGDDEADDGAAARVSLARRLLAGGDVGQGLEIALALQRDNPGAPEAHMLAGDAWSMAGRPAQAIDAYRRAANLRFTEPAALRMISALSRAGRPEEAIRVLDLYLGQNPASIRARVLQADLLMARGRFADAARNLEYLRARTGDGDVAVASNLAWCYYQLDRVDDAVEIAGQAYQRAPANPRVAHSYGWILHKSGRNPRAAMALLRQAAAQAPEWKLARAHLAEVEAVHARASIG